MHRYKQAQGKAGTFEMSRYDYNEVNWQALLMMAQARKIRDRGIARHVCVQPQTIRNWRAGRRSPGSLSSADSLIAYLSSRLSREDLAECGVKHHE
jgi:hypothetical protein